MSDLFHEDVPFDFIDKVFATTCNSMARMVRRSRFEHLEWTLKAVRNVGPRRVVEDVLNLGAGISAAAISILAKNLFTFFGWPKRK